MLLFGLLLIALLGLAWSNRLCLDDAYISFRYARSLVRGRGLVYNEGERVEGYTNFLWVLLVAAGMWLANDHSIARYGIDINHWNWPGHRRVASILYLESRGVHLVIGNPLVVTDPDTQSYCRDTQPLTFVQQILYSGAMLEIPIEEDRVLLAIYLTPSQTVDEAIEREGWKVYPCGVLGWT